ncbi:MAG: type II toxin-antitoxin system prevent-host-death family antitoxin [Pseudomonadota bacterium]
MQDLNPNPRRISTTVARKHLGKLVKRVQHPASYIVLTHHNDPVAALVSMHNLRRIFNAKDIERVINGGETQIGFTFSELVRGHNDRETAERIQMLQIDRLKERQLLARQGLKEVPGGEIRGEVRFVPAEEPVRIAPPVRFWPLAVWLRVRGWFST